MWYLWLFLGALGGAVLSVVGAGAGISGHPVGWAALLFGLDFIAMVWITFRNFRPYRGQPATPVAVDGGLELPLRPGLASQVSILPLLLGLLVCAGTVFDGRMPTIVVGVICLAGGGLLSWQLRRNRLHYLVIRLDPDGIGTADGRRRATWRDVARCEVVDGLFPGIVIVEHSGRATGLRTGTSSWNAEAIRDVTVRAAKRTAFRARLTDPGALAEFLDKQPRPARQSSERE